MSWPQESIIETELPFVHFLSRFRGLVTQDISHLTTDGCDPDGYGDFRSSSSFAGAQRRR